MRGLGVCVCLLLAGAASAEVYRWTDDKGEVHYSDRPAAAAEATRVEIHSKSAAESSAGKPQGYADRELEFRKRQLDKEKQEKKQGEAAAEQEQKQQNCATARNNLRTLQESGRVVSYDEKGERRFMGDSERETAIAKASKDAEQWCK